MTGLEFKPWKLHFSRKYKRWLDNINKWRLGKSHSSCTRKRVVLPSRQFHLNLIQHELKIAIGNSQINHMSFQVNLQVITNFNHQDQIPIFIRLAICDIGEIYYYIFLLVNVLTLIQLTVWTFTNFLLRKC